MSGSSFQCSTLRPVNLLPLAAAILLLSQLAFPPVPGVADNGDFGKLLGRFHLGSGQTFVYANTKYSFADRYGYHSGFNSSELIPISAALGIHRLMPHDDSFDIRLMGAVHASLFVLAVFLAAAVLDLGIGAFALLLLSDFMYTGFFHSFYPESAAYLFLLLAAVFYLRAVKFQRTRDSVGLLLCVFATITASVHYTVLGPWLTLLLWLGRAPIFHGRRVLATVTCLTVLLVSGIGYRFLAPENYAPINPFNVIFSQILPNTAHPDRALKELGLDESYKKWSGLQAYSPGVPMADPAFYGPFSQHTSYARIAFFYARHPSEAWNALKTSLDEAGRFQSPLGNFDSASGKPPAAHYPSFQLASGSKRALFYHRGGFLFVSFLGLAVGVSVWLYRDRNRLPAGALSGGIVLAGAAVSNLVISSLADVYDQFRHQLISFELFDLLLIVLAWLIVNMWTRPVKIKFGNAVPEGPVQRFRLLQNGGDGSRPGTLLHRKQSFLGTRI